MATKLYVGNLSYQATDQELSSLFAEVGHVSSAQVVTDKYTGHSRGFGFVEMATEDEAKQAIAAINGRAVDGRMLTVDESHPRTVGTRGAAPRLVTEDIATTLNAHEYQVAEEFVESHARGRRGSKASTTGPETLLRDKNQAVGDEDVMAVLFRNTMIELADSAKRVASTVTRIQAILDDACNAIKNPSDKDTSE